MQWLQQRGGMRTTALSVSRFTAADSTAGSASRMRRTAAEQPPHFMPRTSSTTVAAGSADNRRLVASAGRVRSHNQELFCFLKEGYCSLHNNNITTHSWGSQVLCALSAYKHCPVRTTVNKRARAIQPPRYIESGLLHATHRHFKCFRASTALLTKLC